MTVTIPYDPQWKAHIWAKKHCPSYTTNTVLATNDSDRYALYHHSIVYYFSDACDVTMFTLKWS
jgi:hypothetical protein